MLISAHVEYFDNTERNTFIRVIPRLGTRLLIMHGVYDTNTMTGWRTGFAGRRSFTSKDVHSDGLADYPYLCCPIQ